MPRRLFLWPGYTASADVKARTERVSGTVYAFASDRVIRISTDGKSAAQLESEIREHLAGAGAGECDMPEIVLTKDGEEFGGPSAGKATIKIKKTLDDSGAAKLVVEIGKDGQTVTAEIPNPDTAGDAAIRSAIQAEIDRAGIDLRIDVTNGEIRCETP